MADDDIKLVKLGNLEPEGDRAQPWYTAMICLSCNRLLLIDSNDTAYNVRMYRSETGILIAISERLRARPWDVCVLEGNESEIAVSLDDGSVQIMYVESTESSTVIKPVRRIQTKLEECYGMQFLRSQGNLVLSGVYQQMFCWCLLSVVDGEVGTIRRVCEYKGFGGFLSTSNDQFDVYISCYAGLNTGVYGYQTMNGKHKFTYTHNNLANPRGLCVDSKGYIYVCNCGYPACIHLVSQEGEPVMVFKEGISPFPPAICLDGKQDEFIVTSFKSSGLSRFRIEWRDKHDTAAIPAEILKMDDRSIRLFKEALKDGEVRVYNIRVMVVGHMGVGKTTLIKRILGEEVNITDRRSTEGIIVHVHCCRVSRETLKWTLNKGDYEQNLRLKRLADVMNNKLQKPNWTDKVEELVAANLHGELTYDINKRPLWQDVGQNIPSCSTKENLPSIQNKDQTKVKEPDSVINDVGDDPAVELLKLLRDKANKLKEETDEHVPVTIADFAGQYSFYTTHQTFLTERAIYLLVSDVSQQVTDPVIDEYYFDIEGIKLCKVYELVEVWLNSIHSCASSPEADTPPVILVGTHVDKIQQESREEMCEKYFRHIRCEYLGIKPTIVHLADEDFALDNTVIDPKVDDLKKKIVQLASNQPYWGEKIPARWLPLEERLMSLKHAGVKVIAYSLLEKMNEEIAVKIKSREELDLFLRFQHDIGNILYFGTEELKEHIMLDPQWLIHALRTLVTAEDFILKKIKKLTVVQMWREFKNTGKLTQELIDAIWTKENNSDFHDNKDLLLLIMEKLNIIARKKEIIKIGQEVKVKKCFIAPCMLSEKTPIHIVSPEHHPEMESSSVLCYVFTGKFLPSPIFHRLIAACVSQWPIAMKKSKNLIFCGCCVFEVDPCHKLTLLLKDYVIFARVTKTSKINKILSSDVCIQIKKFIDDTLATFIGYMCQNLTFEMYIQCHQSPADCMETMFPVLQLQDSEELICSSHDNEHAIASNDLLKFWFKDKQDQTHSVTSDLTTDEKCQSSVRRRALPPGKKYHVFFSFSSSDIHWVKETVERLERDYGFVCCEYDRDNAPGTPLLPFAEDSIKYACRTVVVMSMDAFKSGFVLHEIQMALLQGFSEGRKHVVPLLLKDCEVPGHLSVLNYIDARDPNRRDIWWPKLLMELDTQVSEDKVSVAVSIKARNYADEESKDSVKTNEDVIAHLYTDVPRFISEQTPCGGMAVLIRRWHSMMAAIFCLKI
ncbi:hypothetical protein CHS0354_010727 [Potamilus streckersoni]|uniref:non-specific serine/threonine protein kinase n=1 Tax=Potamilus streckersoni TaxID=2493646 RepID=A0AAE0SUS7_9BIVA|nr:hypothetical protein CHS0354_010727 [Potamilus streckersoni]